MSEPPRAASRWTWIAPISSARRDAYLDAFTSGGARDLALRAFARASSSSTQTASDKRCGYSSYMYIKRRLAAIALG
eukprot:30769-Pelagococcus_subviridis.AAC.11